MGDVTVLPGDPADTERVRFAFTAKLGAQSVRAYATTGAAAADRPMMLADLTTGGPAALWQLSPTGFSVESIRVAGGWLGYQVRRTNRVSAQNATARFVLPAHLRVMHLSDLEPARLDANSAFKRVVLP